MSNNIYFSRISWRGSLSTQCPRRQEHQHRVSHNWTLHLCNHEKVQLRICLETKMRWSVRLVGRMLQNNESPPKSSENFECWFCVLTKLVEKEREYWKDLCLFAISVRFMIWKCLKLIVLRLCSIKKSYSYRKYLVERESKKPKIYDKSRSRVI